MLKRILIALAISFSAIQAAQACGTCGCRDKKKADEHAHDHDHDHGPDGHSHDTDDATAKTADAAKIVSLKTSGTFSKVKKKIQFTAADGKVYTLNKKMIEKVTPLLDQKVDVVAKVKTDPESGKSAITSIKKIKPAKN